MFEPLPIKSTTPKEQEQEGFTPLPIKTQRQEPIKPVFEPLPISAKYPNLYGIYGATKETGKSVIPYIKYVDPEEREKFMKLSQQKQTRELLLQNLEAVALFGIQPIAKGSWNIFSKYLPRTAAKLKAIAKTHIAGKKPGLKTEPIPEEPGPVTSERLTAQQRQAEIERVMAEPDMPKYAGSVNLERQAISNEAKHLELEMFEKHGIKTKVSHEQLINKAHNIIEGFKTDPEHYAQRIAAIKAGKTPTIEEELAHRVINATKFEKFVEATKGIADGTVAPEVLEAMQAELMQTSLTVANPLAAQAGRRLSMYNIEVGKNRAFKAIGKLRKKLNPRQLKELGDVDWDDAMSVNQFVQRLPDPKLKDYFYEFWYNAILSGIPTHVVNTVSNTAWIAFQVPHRALTAAVDKTISTLTGKARTRYLNEVVPMMAGYKTGARRGMSGAWDVAKHGRIQEFESKWAQEIGHVLGAFSRSPNKIVRGIGAAITPPSKALRGMDVWANSIAYDAQMNALARRASNVKGLAGQARRTFEKAFVENPSKDAHVAALEYAKYNTFMDDPGWFSASAIKMRNRIPGGRLVVPFVRTIGNLLKRGVEMTPGAGLFLARGQNPAEVAAKQIEGAVVSMYVLAKCEAGEITGAAPTSQTERAAFHRQGKKAWSIRIGNEWYQYRRVEPFNTVIASAAIAYDRIKNAKDDDEATEIFTNMVYDFKNNLIDSSYMQQVTRLLNRYGQAKGMIPRMASSLVPYSGFFRSINRAYEAQMEGTAKYRDTTGWIGAFSTVIPFMWEKAPAKLNVWGEEIELEGGVFRQWLPYKWSTETEDITELALEKLEVYPGLPRQEVTIGRDKIKLPDDIYRDYCIAYGHAAKKKLDKLFAMPTRQRALADKTQHYKLTSEIDSMLKSEGISQRYRAIKAYKQRKRGLRLPKPQLGTL